MKKLLVLATFMAMLLAALPAHAADESGDTAASASAPWVEEATVPVENVDDLAVDVSGDRMIVGTATSTPCCVPTHAAMYRFDGSAWIEEAMFEAAEIADGDTSFGVSVALDGELAVVGAPRGGVVYVFEFNGTEWRQQARLEGSGGWLDGFGRSLDLEGEQLVISSASDGAAYIYELRRGRWTQEAVLRPAADALWFGTEVATGGDVVAVQGEADSDPAVYVFERDRRHWGQSDILTPLNEDHARNYGDSLAISEQTLVVGSVGFDIHEIPGEAYVYGPGGTGWELRATLAANLTPPALDFFGESVAIDGKTIAVAAPGVFFAARVHTFREVAGSWVHEQAIVADFPCCVALSGDVLAVADFSPPSVVVYRHRTTP